MFEASPNKKPEELPCQSEPYGRFCQTLDPAVPCCGPLEQIPHSPKQGIFSFPGEMGLKELFEIRHELTKGGFFKFRNTSDCMFPTLKRGDLLKVEPATVREMKVGDIAVFRNGDLFYSHRVINKREPDHIPVIVTGTDTAAAQEQADFDVADENLVGRVVQVERRGRFLSPARKKPGLGEKISYSLFQTGWGLERKKRAFLISLLEHLQSLPLYRSLGRRASDPFRRKAAFHLLLPVHPHVEGKFLQKIPLDQWEVQELNYPHLHWIVTYEDRKIGFLSLIRRPEICPFGGWWISAFYIRFRFRGLGFGMLLMRRFEKWVRQKRVMESVRISFPSSDLEAHSFLFKMGFRSEAQKDHLRILKKQF